jgi:predicted transcriptional regulator
MTLQEVAQLVKGDILCGAERAQESVEHGFASDLMSDVLTLKNSNFLLITGLANIQSVRTAEMSDTQYILFVRNKAVTPEMLELAEDSDIVILRSPYSMFKTAGILYGAGLQPVY